MAINYGSLQATLTPRGVVSGKVQNATRAFVKDYDLLDNKPKVNGVELSGDKSLDDLGIEIPEIVANPGDTTENLTSIRIDGVNYNIQGSGGSAVTSVNGKTGDVMLDAEDVGALPDDTPIPSELADLSEDSTHRTVTDTEKTDWNAKADISDLPTVNNSTITIQKNNQNVDSFTLNQDSNKSINISVPTKTSDLQNDNSFITNTVNNLANYYLKTQTYTQAEVDALIQAAVNGRFQKVNSLPASGEPNVIYLVPKTTPETSNACDEYIWQDNAWELIGSTEIDLSDYVTDEDLTTALADYLTTSAFNTAISNYYTKTEVGTLLDNKVDKVNGKGLSTYDYDATAKGIVDNVTSNLADKVDKVQGKGLSTNDYDNTAKGIVDGVTNALVGKANISEMSVTDGTGADADKTTIQLKSGTSATVLKTHQDISGKADKVSGAINGNLAGLDANGNLTDSGVAKTDIDEMQDELSTDSATATGNPINFSTKSAQNVVSTIIDLEPIQDLSHGVPSPDNICPISGRTEIGILGTNGKESTDPDYEVSNNLTISLGQTVYGGSLDVENGVLVVDKKGKNLGSLSWTYDSSVTYPYFYATISDMLIGQSGTDFVNDNRYICSCYSKSNDVNPQTRDIGDGAFSRKVLSGATTDVLCVRDIRYTDATTFTSAVNNETFVYPLATPITIQLTPHQISLLEGVNNISTTGDKITLTYRDGKVATLGDIKELRDYVDSKPSGGGHNYSETEQVVGTWIDGKTVYERSIVKTRVGSPAASRDYVNVEDLSSTNIDKIIKAEGSWFDGGTVRKSFPWADASAMLDICYNQTSKYLQILFYGFVGYDIYDVFIIIQYTKSTT